jgi:hypothetical protein
VKLYIPLNAPGETEDTLRETIARIHQLYALFGRDNVQPFIFFVGIQPNTPVERLLIEQGYLDADYDPLTLNPFVLKRLLYNPPPLGRMIGRAYLEARRGAAETGDYVGRETMANLEKVLGAAPEPRRAVLLPRPSRPQRPVHTRTAAGGLSLRPDRRSGRSSG